MVKALIIIDMLEGYMKDTDTPQKIVQNQIDLISTFKNQGLKVIFTIPNLPEFTPPFMTTL
ncbi:MAG: isochorismatase family protein [Theionarchaea archaeon]|nr:isochorismatase family protein [Theionarchaea archaeon]